MSEPYLRPLPAKSPGTEPFWEAAAEHRLVIPKCQNCGDWNWIPYPGCRTCLSEDQVWTPASGYGTLMTWSIVSRGPPGFPSPYVTALVELDERPRSMVMLGNIVDTPHEDLKVGMRMQVVFEDIADEDISIWRFKAA
ncbi:Zn-ribbon domain-containing OB-fold protein [Sphingomonas crocodyli]|uniref:Zn-ribbon domain-containing OB-fold protein n=1 Tax=Sphingomonas crocodyli TaxID=1979270 RepID=A0A437LVK7_9SPHN|nr:OB-fold domain-containing protein [Sphingomonas crocodyli]RVT89417.1 hypothetical protein EOD43_21880 [Sphingomonas crocodyli]